MHTNYAGVMELLCRLGCVCAPTGLEPLPDLLSRARLLVIPPSTGCYNSVKKCWMSQPSSLFAAETIREVLRFVQEGGRLLLFAYRFGDSFTRSNLRELISPLGCLLNDDAVVDLQLLRNTHPLDAYFDTPQMLLPLSWSRAARHHRALAHDGDLHDSSGRKHQAAGAVGGRKLHQLQS